MDIYECIKCGGEVKEVIPPKKKEPTCPECNNPINRFFSMDYIDTFNTCKTFKCESCKETYYGNYQFGDTECRPKVELKTYNSSKEKKCYLKPQ